MTRPARFPALALGLLAALSLPARAAPPAEIEQDMAQAMAECRDVGGNPTLHPDYLTEGEFNGDGRPDYITNLDRLDCEGAWSYFCGSAGCPVTVWLSGPAGYSVAWGSHAQAVEVRDGKVVVSLHGQFCSPPRTGADGCEQVLDLAAAPKPDVQPPQPAAPAPAVQTPTVQAPAGQRPAAPPPPSPARWELRQPPNNAPAVAVVGGPGNLRSMAAFCLGGKPWLAMVFAPMPANTTVQVAFTFAEGRLGGPAVRQASTGDAYVIGLAGHDLAKRLAGSGKAVGVAMDGRNLGTVTLAGSSAALRKALAPCLKV